jgi:hypothetical protein
MIDGWKHRELFYSKKMNWDWAGANSNDQSAVADHYSTAIDHRSSIRVINHRSPGHRPSIMVIDYRPLALASNAGLFSHQLLYKIF